MYPYFYPCYFSASRMMDATRSMPPLSPGALSQICPGTAAVPTPQYPSMPGTAPAPPTTDFPPTPGTTAGSPVESTPPAPVTIAEPQVTLGQQEVAPPVIANTEFTQGFLRTQIGKRARIEFLIGTNSITDRIGTIVDVGISYILLQPAETDDLLMADIYAIKFVTIYR